MRGQTDEADNSAAQETSIQNVSYSQSYSQSFEDEDLDGKRGTIDSPPCATHANKMDPCSDEEDGDDFDDEGLPPSDSDEDEEEAAAAAAEVLSSSGPYFQK